MIEQAARGRLLIRAPAPALARFVKHYWLSLDNDDPVYRVVPDGCVDVVVEVAGGAWRAWGYGSVTAATDLDCARGTHYFGIRFLPGQSRHFMRACASELTDCKEDARGLLRGPIEPLAERVEDAVFDEADRRLAGVLGTSAPAVSEVDRMVRRIDASRGALRIEALAAELGKSPRQLQRLFLETVGVTAKFYSLIARARHAAGMIAAREPARLADVATQAGYADQSHMTRDFARLAGVPPARLDDGFLQDAEAPSIEY